jgi:hypothetical protein
MKEARQPKNPRRHRKGENLKSIEESSKVGQLKKDKSK